MGYKYYNQQTCSNHNARYDGGTISDSGCGGAAAAMLAHNHSVKWAPSTVCDWYTKHTYAGCGTAWGGPTDFFNSNGMYCKQFGGYANQYGTKKGNAEKEWKRAMQEKGTPNTGILLMGPSIFTTGGHYITIRNIKKQSDGTYKYLVWDPYSKGLCQWMTWDKFSGKVKQFYYVDSRWKVKNSTSKLNGYSCGKSYTAVSDRPIRKGMKASSKQLGIVKKGNTVSFKKLHRGYSYLWGKTDSGWMAVKRLSDNKKYFK